MNVTIKFTGIQFEIVIGVVFFSSDQRKVRELEGLSLQMSIWSQDLLS